MRHGGVLSAPRPPPVKVSEKVYVSGSPDHLVNKLLHQGGGLEKQMAAALCVQPLSSVGLTLERAGEGRGGSRVRLCSSAEENTAGDYILLMVNIERAFWLGAGVVVEWREFSLSSGQGRKSPWAFTCICIIFSVLALEAVGARNVCVACLLCLKSRC